MKHDIRCSECFAEPVCADDEFPLGVSCEEMRQIIRVVRKHFVDADKMVPTWVRINERLPHERISKLTQNFCEYPCIYRAKNTGEREVRYYKYGSGHFWHGSQIMDEHIIAWSEPMPLPEQPKEDGRMKCERCQYHTNDGRCLYMVGCPYK